MNGAGQQLFAGAGFSFDEHWHVADCNPPRPLDQPHHHRTRMQDIGELWGGRWLSGTLLAQTLVAITQEVRDEIDRDIKRHGCGLDAVIARRLDKFSRKARLTKQHPYGRHGWCAWTQVEGQLDLARMAACNSIAGANRSLVYFLKIGWSSELLDNDLKPGGSLAA